MQLLVTFISRHASAEERVLVRNIDVVGVRNTGTLLRVQYAQFRDKLKGGASIYEVLSLHSFAPNTSR